MQLVHLWSDRDDRSQTETQCVECVHCVWPFFGPSSGLSLCWISFKTLDQARFQLFSLVRSASDWKENEIHAWNSRLTNKAKFTWDWWYWIDWIELKRFFVISLSEFQLNAYSSNSNSDQRLFVCLTFSFFHCVELDTKENAGRKTAPREGFL